MLVLWLIYGQAVALALVLVFAVTLVRALVLSLTPIQHRINTALAPFKH